MNVIRAAGQQSKVLWAGMVAGFLLLGVPAISQASTIFTAALSGSQETPPNASPATGFGTFVLNDAMTDLSFDITFSGLVAPSIAAHFHDAPAGVAGPIVRGMTPAEFTPGLTSGTIIGDWLATDSQPLTPALVNELLSGNIYFNIHSTVFPGGEIRGQLIRAVAVPEPGGVALLGSGMVGFVGLRVLRRRRSG